ARRSDLSSVPAAVPAYHDDNVRGAFRWFAARTGHRHRLGAASPAWNCDRRRIARESGPDALYDTRYLPLLRSAGGEIAQNSAGGTTCSCSGVMNISAPFIRRPVGTALLTAAVALAGIV